MIAIINYGCGNISAFATIYKRLNVAVTIAESVEHLRAADKFVLPGVGAFDRAMERLTQSGMRECLEELVLGDKKPVLGVCVGMQMLAYRSEEGRSEGLGWIGGEVKKFDISKFSQATHLPHMGWNDVQSSAGVGLFEGLDSAARFYFLHSYYFSPSKQENVLAVTDYGETFVSAVGSENIYGVQFHPEKSHQWGVRLLKNFAEL